MRICLDARSDHLLGNGLYNTEAAFACAALCYEFTIFESKERTADFRNSSLCWKALFKRFLGPCFQFLSLELYLGHTSYWPITVAARSKSWVRGSSLAGIVGSNPAGGIVACLLLVLYDVRTRYLRQADPLSRGALPRVCDIECNQVQP